MWYPILALVSFLLGYAFRGAIGREIKAVGTDVAKEVKAVETEIKGKL